MRSTARYQRFFFLFVLLLLLLGVPYTDALQGGYATISPLAGHTTTAYAAERQVQEAQRMVPFLYRPYYGNRTILSRTISFVDHDQPWYADDGLFVRYDGVTRSGSSGSVYDCYTGLSCYDGHNGYDLDFAFEPVLSSAGGTVIRSGWYNPLNHNSSFGLWVAIDHGNGLVSAYGHLSSLLVSVGDHVNTQWQIGTSGTTGASTGPHLHMSVYYLPDWDVTDPFGWRGRYADPNIVTDRYLWVDAPKAKTAVPYLGGRGKGVYHNAVLVDDDGPGWSSTGMWYSDSFSTDIKGSLHWATTSNGDATATSTWRPYIPADGYYEIGVYVDDTHATSGWVPYTVYSANPSKKGSQSVHTVRLDASHIGIFGGPFGTVNTGTQWVGLGTYYFHKGTTGRVVMSNATGERSAQIAADAIEFVPVNGD